MLDLIMLGALAQFFVPLDARGCAWDDDEAREEDPGAERGEEVVQARDGV